MDGIEPISVLIADDEPSIRNGLSNTILWESIPAKVIGLSSDGVEAFDFIENYRPDIVITDIRMPKLDGLALIQKTREAMRDTEFIILSGYDDFSYAQRAINLGVKAFVLKPFRRNELMDELTKISLGIRERRSNDERLKHTDFASIQLSSKKYFLNQLVRNEVREIEEITNKSRDLGIALRNAPLRSLVISIHCKTDAMTEQCMDLARKIFEHGMEKIPFEIWKQESSQLLALINEDNDKNTFSLVSGFLPELLAIQDCRISIGLGDLVPTLAQSFISFNTALLALSYQLYDPSRILFDSSLICTDSPPVSAASIDTDPLVDAICRSDKKEIISYCENFFHVLFYSPMPPPSFIKGMCIYLITDVQKSLMRQIGFTQDIFPEISYLEINELISFHEIKDWMIALFTEYGNVTLKNAANKNDAFIEKAKRYIQVNIEKKILAEDVAFHVNLSVTYFTIYFKSKTGINFRDYILNMKNEYAKQLLCNPDTPINEISERLGYEDYRSFSRAFKKCTGLTPSEYQTRYDVRKKKD